MIEPLICISIINFNGVNDTIECIKSLKNASYKNLRVYVVDNCSKKDETRLIKQEFSDIKTIRLHKNLGFGGANNLALKSIIEENPRCKYILFLNNDTVIDRKFLHYLVKTIEKNPKIAAVGGKILSYNKDQYFDSAGSYLTDTGYAHSIGNNIKDIGQYDKIKEVLFISACGLLVTADAVKKILKNEFFFDPFFFMYLEEVDLGIRLKKNGYKIYYDPRAIVWHKVSNSIKNQSINTKVFKRYYSVSNQPYLFLKHYPLNIFLMKIPIILGNYLYIFIYLAYRSSLMMALSFLIRLFRSFYEGIKKRNTKNSRLWTYLIIKTTYRDFFCSAYIKMTKRK